MGTFAATLHREDVTKQGRVRKLAADCKFLHGLASSRYQKSTLACCDGKGELEREVDANSFLKNSYESVPTQITT